MTSSARPSNADLLERSRRRAEALASRDFEVRAAWPDEAALARLRTATSCLDALMFACEAYADRPCLIDARTLTFAELWRRVAAVAAGITRFGVAAGDRVGIAGFASADWVIADLACLASGAVSVPLHMGTAPADLVEIARATQLRAIIGRGDLPAVTGVRVVTIDELERDGQGRSAGVSGPVDPDRLRTIVYTSGSGGRPKGAVFPERVWLEYWRDPARGVLPPLPGIRLACLPLSHIAGRRQLLYSLVTGGVTHFMSTNEMSALLDEIRRVRPTVLMLVPRISALIHQHFLSERLRRPGEESGIRQEMRDAFLGDRLLLVITGSAPTSPEVAAFLPDCFDVPVLRGYATTEAGVLTFDERPVANVQSFTLADVPALGYRTSDTPYPRGELRVKTRAMVPGYFEDPVASRSLFDAGGYMRTGDVVEQRGDELHWIDRVDDVVKLADGRFVEISRLEGLYAAGSPLIRQIYLQAEPRLAAVIVPAMDAIRTLSAEDVSREADVERLLLAELRRIAVQAQLRAHELPERCLVVTEPFGAGNGLLTASGKLARHRLKAAFGEPLERLAREPEPAQARTVGDTVKELVRPFLNATWRCQELPDNVPLGAEGLALDSMALLEALLACEAHFGVALRVEDLRVDSGRALTLAHVIDLIAAKCARAERCSA